MSVAVGATFDLIRHGETEGGQRYRGWLDDPLSAVGWAQMRAAVDGACPWQAVVSSPLRRCRAFAEELCANTGLPLAIDDRLKEIGFGDWEGRSADEIERRQPGALLRYYADPLRHTPDGGESLETFSERVAAGWDALCRRHADQSVLLVTHAGVIRMVLVWVLGLPTGNLFRIKVDHAAITRIRCDAGEPPFCQLLFHDGTLLKAARIDR